MSAGVRHLSVGRKRTVAALVITFLLLLGVGIRQDPSLGPWAADSLRWVIGDRAVTRIEEGVPELEDRVRRALEPRAKPRSSREIGLAPLPVSSHAPLAASTGGSAGFEPAKVGPMDARVAAAGDGVWTGVLDPARLDKPPLLFTTLLHPDVRRSWAEVFVLAVPVAAVRLYAVAGTDEPRATTAQGRAYVRRGLIPPEHRERLLVAFNGGFKTEHGHFGMSVEHVVLVPPRQGSCTLLARDDGTVRIETWTAHFAEASSTTFWRQAAPCMYERNVLNPLLANEDVRDWEATLDGSVVIRRSAVGLNATTEVLFIAISNDTTARAIADAVHHAGASDILQLDVNWSYPKIVLFPVGADGKRYPSLLFPGFLLRKGEYVERAAPRDFFYLVRRTL